MGGAVALFSLPIAQYPEITPPVVQVSASYPGANPQVLADTVAAPIEQEVNGVENMLYMSSTCTSDGAYTLKVTFALGTDADTATILVQNRVQRAMPRLPETVQRQGVNTKKTSTSFVGVFCLYSPDKKFDDLFLANYANISIKDAILRLKGVGDIFIFPSKDYGMRIWLDPSRLEYNSLTATDVVNALKQQNVQVAAGQIGQQPAKPGQHRQLSVNTLGRLTEVEQFEDIVVKSTEGGRIVRLKDVARVELGGKSYDTVSFLRGSPSAAIVVFQSPWGQCSGCCRCGEEQTGGTEERLSQGSRLQARVRRIGICARRPSKRWYSLFSRLLSSCSSWCSCFYKTGEQP